MFRYRQWLPEFPDVPIAANSSTTIPCVRQINMSSLHYLDSSRFIVSSNVYDHSPTSGRHLRHRASRSRRSQRRRTNKNKSPVLRTSSTDSAVIDLDCFRLIFIAVDVAVVAFHVCRGYIDLQRCRCRAHDAAALNNGGLTTTNDPDNDPAGLGRLLPPPPPSDGVVLAVCNDSMTATHSAVHERESDVLTCRRQSSTDSSQRQLQQSCVVVTRTTTTLVCRVVRSRSLLPLLACAFILAATHCVVRTCWRLSSAHLTQSTSTLVFASAVRFQTAAANTRLTEDTRHLDSAVLQLSSDSMTQDLHNLVSIVDYFRQGLRASRVIS